MSVEFTNTALISFRFHFAKYRIPSKTDNPWTEDKVISVIRLEPSVSDDLIVVNSLQNSLSDERSSVIA